MSECGKLLRVEETESGYVIFFEKAEFEIYIDPYQQCYENWGYLSSDDEFESYYGKDLAEARLTDTALNQKKVDDTEYYEYDVVSNIQFMDFIFTDGAVLQFAVYNSHNGYYGHDVRISKRVKLFEDVF